MIFFHSSPALLTGVELRRQMEETRDTLLQITGHHKLGENNKVLRRLIENREAYLTPINMLQVEILRRLRLTPDDQQLRDALLVAINGIAAGMVSCTPRASAHALAALPEDASC